MKKSLTLLFVCTSACCCAQKLNIELFGGFSNYQGDLQAKKYTLNQAKLAVGLGLSYKVTSHFSIRGTLNTGKIQAEDKKSNSQLLRKRNLGFRSPILDASLVGQYHLFDLEYKRFTPYAMAGVSLFRFKPHTFDTLGNKINLQPLSTEGQGLPQYPDRKPYQLTQFAIPLGVGVKFVVSETVTLGWEIGLRKTFTDYLDDVSTTYVDYITLLNAKGQQAVDIAYRGDEVKDGDPFYPVDGTQRGGSKQKDWYYFSGVTATIKFPTGGNGGSILSGGKKSRTGCPVNF
ncbi:MAG: DUF6089 family protein [Chitinophagaceae bacterium]|nr:DUF6089 family protein [Chitinophagaceae bacterium]